MDVVVLALVASVPSKEGGAEPKDAGRDSVAVFMLEWRTTRERGEGTPSREAD